MMIHIKHLSRLVITDHSSDHLSDQSPKVTFSKIKISNNIDHIDMCAERAAVYNELGKESINSKILFYKSE